MPDGLVVDVVSGRPLAAVVVSDGLHVVATDAEGRFRIPERVDAEFVVVTVPSTHHALRGDWFADIRSGDGGDLRFELAPRDVVTNGCRFVQVTDLHVSVDGGERIRPMLEAGVQSPPGVRVMGEIDGAALRADLALIVDRVAPDFVAATGDLADYGQPEELVAYRDAGAGLATPIVSVPGNHDQLSVLTRANIDAFFAEWAARADTEGQSVSEAFQREVFGGDWRRPASGRTPWLDVLGPMYFSFDWGGVHFVAYDGEGLRRYGADYPQDEWLANDLAALATGTPVFVLTHFPEDRGFYRSRFADVRLLGSVSGHWHGSRVWHDGDAPHWTSATTGFAGIDFTPRGFRVVDVDADGVRTRWEEIERPRPAGRHVTGAVAVVEGRIVVATERPDGRGCVLADGAWTRDLPVAARSGVVAGGDLVCALDLGATLWAFDATTGETRWSRALDDPSRRWNLSLPVVDGDRVYAGSAASVHAFATDGNELWRRDLAGTDWAASWSGLAVHDDTVVIGAANDDLHVAALDADTGAERWRHTGRDIAGVTATPVVVDGQVLVVRAPGWLSSYALHDGGHRWDAPLDEAWPVALAVRGDRAFVRSAAGTVSAHAIDDGEQLWEHALGPGPRAGRPYSRRPGGARQSLLVLGATLWTATHDELAAIDTESGASVSRVRASGEIASVAAVADGVVAVGLDGSVTAGPV